MSYEFTGRYSPNQLASGLQTYGSTGAAMSPEQNNPVQMPHNNQKISNPAQSQPDLSFIHGTTKELWTPEQTGLYNDWMNKYSNELSDAASFNPGGMSNMVGGGWEDYNTGQNNAWGDSLAGMDTNADYNVYNPSQFAAAMQNQRQQSDLYDQNGGWLKQGGMGGNDLGNIDISSRYESGGMGGNDLGDVNLTPKKLPSVDYAFTGRTQSPEQNSPTEQKGNWLQGITRNPVNKDLAIMASNLVMPGMGKIWGANTAPTYSAAPNTTFGQKAAHVADNFVRNLPLIGTPYALATDLYRKSQADTYPYSRPAMQSNFEKWAPTVPYGNGMDMADPSYLQNMALAKAMADKGIGQQYAFTRGQ